MPLVSLIVMPSAVLSSVLMPFGLDGPALTVMGKAIAAVIAIAQWISARSPLDAVGLAPASAVALLSAALVILALATTRLRLAAVPLAIVGAALMLQRDLPDVMIAEDARLVAMRTPDGALAVNRPRPSAFAMENWQRALMAGDVVAPTTRDGDISRRRPARNEGFVCGDSLCLARHADGAMIAHAADANAARDVCAAAELIVIDEATTGNPCSSREVRVITKRETARRGSIAVRFAPRTEDRIAEVAFALGEERRPWHAHRAYSRAARGLPPN